MVNVWFQAWRTTACCTQLHGCWLQPLGASHAADGETQLGLSLCFCPFPLCQDIQQLLQLQQLVLVPGHHLQPPAQFLLPQAQQSQPGKTSARLTPSLLLSALRHLPLAHSPSVSPGLLPTPNLFQLPQQTQGALLTSQPRAGLPTQVRLSTAFLRPLAAESARAWGEGGKVGSLRTSPTLIPTGCRNSGKIGSMSGSAPSFVEWRESNQTKGPQAFLNMVAFENQ